jgi:hypothetical protein
MKPIIDNLYSLSGPKVSNLFQIMIFALKFLIQTTESR